MTKAKFNILDALIILLIILVVAAGIFLFAGKGSNETPATQNTTAEFKLEIKKAEFSLAEKFEAASKAGEIVRVGVKEAFEAELVDVEVSNAEIVSANTRTGEIILAEHPSLYDIIITLRAPAVDTDQGIMVSGTKIIVGHEDAVYGKGFAGFGFITDLKTSNK